MLCICHDRNVCISKMLISNLKWFSADSWHFKSVWLSSQTCPESFQGGSYFYDTPWTF